MFHMVIRWPLAASVVVRWSPLLPSGDLQLSQEASALVIVCVGIVVVAVVAVVVDFC